MAFFIGALIGGIICWFLRGKEVIVVAFELKDKSLIDRLNADHEALANGDETRSGREIDKDILEAMECLKEYNEKVCK